MFMMNWTFWNIVISQKKKNVINVEHINTYLNNFINDNLIVFTWGISRKIIIYQDLMHIILLLL